MFECYGVPQVAYAIDGICGAYNYGLKDNALIISSSHHSTNVIPILDGKMLLPHCKRIPVGGFHHSDLLQKSLSLKYP
jgi:actin-related protein 5